MPHAFTRRDVLRGLTALAVAATAQRTSAEEPGLRAIADRKRIGFGAAVDGRMLKDKAYAAQLVRECNLVVPRNALKWSATEKRPGRFAFGEADAILRFAEEHDMTARGHTLVWHNAPDWVGKLREAREMRAAVERHIEAVAGRYAGRIASWDVVNEPLEYDNPALRDSAFLRALGEDYIAFAFETARRVDPDAQLVLNETHLCKAGDNYAARRTLMLDLVGRLQDRNVPIDAIGIQGHFRPGFDTLDRDGFGEFCRALERRGLAVLITELDASCKFLNRVKGFTDEDYAPLFRDLIDVAATEGNLTAVVMWGLTARGGTSKEPKGPNKECKARINLYDADDRPLPTRAAVAEALSAL